MLTHDLAEAESRRNDPLISPQIAIPVLVSLFDTANRVVNGAASIQVPTLVLSAGRDLVVHTEPQYTFFDNLGSKHKRFETFPTFFHEIFHEVDRHKAFKLVRDFVQQCFSQDPDHLVVRPANQTQFARLSKPAPWALRSLGYAVARMTMKTIGQRSDGIRVGFANGFDSGPMLDYVYTNESRGIGWLGSTIDRIYLNSTGWQGIRQRATNLESLLLDEIRRLRSNNETTPKIVDLAAGPGRYLQRVLKKFQDGEISVLCRDMDELALEQGRLMARTAGLVNIQYMKGDALDAASLADLKTDRPDIVIVSGLYELIADNDQVHRSLSAIAEVITDDGSLIITNQPHHPQLAFIARTLCNHQGKRWVMRPRAQTEMYNLLRESGFTPTRMLSDDAGIFTVTVARKNR